MKKLYISLLLNMVFLSSYSQSTLIPDSNFEQALIDLNIDSDGLNGSILNSDASQVIANLDISFKNISDLTGIDAFQNMESLNCSYNNLTTLDLSMNNNSLLYLNAQSNMLTSVNLTGVQNLITLQVQDNNLSSLDLSLLPNLYFLECYTNNINSLDFSNNYALNSLSCGENQLTGILDISNLINLEFFACLKNHITQINMSFHPYLNSFNCRSNDVSNIDLTQCYALNTIYVDSNELMLLNVANGSNNQILDFHAEGNANLLCINVDDSALSTNSPLWHEDSQSYYSISCNSLGMKENESNEINVSPNPVTDYVVVKMKNMVATHSEIVSINGRIVMEFELTSTTNHLNLKDIESGTYFLKIGSLETRLVKLD